MPDLGETLIAAVLGTGGLGGLAGILTLVFRRPVTRQEVVSMSIENSRKESKRVTDPLTLQNAQRQIQNTNLQAVVDWLEERDDQERELLGRHADYDVEMVGVMREIIAAMRSSGIPALVAAAPSALPVRPPLTLSTFRPRPVPVPIPVSLDDVLQRDGGTKPDPAAAAADRPTP